MPGMYLPLGVPNVNVNSVPLDRSVEIVVFKVLGEVILLFLLLLLRLLSSCILLLLLLLKKSSLLQLILLLIEVVLIINVGIAEKQIFLFGFRSLFLLLFLNHRVFIVRWWDKLVNNLLPCQTDLLNRLHDHRRYRHDGFLSFSIPVRVHNFNNRLVSVLQRTLWPHSENVNDAVLPRYSNGWVWFAELQSCDFTRVCLQNIL